MSEERSDTTDAEELVALLHKAAISGDDAVVRHYLNHGVSASSLHYRITALCKAKLYSINVCSMNLMKT